MLSCASVADLERLLDSQVVCRETKVSRAGVMQSAQPARRGNRWKEKVKESAPRTTFAFPSIEPKEKVLAVARFVRGGDFDLLTNSGHGVRPESPVALQHGAAARMKYDRRVRV